MRPILILCLFMIISASCGDDSSTPSVVLPSNLVVTVTQSEEDSTHIDVVASADNVNFFRFNFGDGTTTEQNSGVISHNYSSYGDFSLLVTAHVTATGYIGYTETIEVPEPQSSTEIPTTGYSTPESYEGMTLVWQDEFSGSELNTDDWTYEIGNGTNGWGNNELQYYTEDNTTVEDGHLIIEAKKESKGGQSYTSSRIITNGKQTFQYGRVDIRAVLPYGQGIWPALWMLGSNIGTIGWPACGELDIMEMVGGGSGRDNVVYGTIHWSDNGNHASYGGNYTLSGSTFADEYHVFSIVWDEDAIKWYVDDVLFNEADITPSGLDEFHEEFFFIFNLAVGGDWPGSPNSATLFPQQMVVDYIRVFQNN